MRKRRRNTQVVQQNDVTRFNENFVFIVHQNNLVPHRVQWSELCGVMCRWIRPRGSRGVKGALTYMTEEKMVGKYVNSGEI